MRPAASTSLAQLRGSGACCSLAPRPLHQARARVLVAPRAAAATGPAVRQAVSAVSTTQLVSVEALAPAPVRQRGPGLPVVVVGLLVAALAGMAALKKLRSQGGQYSDVMRNVNTVHMDELDPEIIAAARARRSRERANQRVELEDLDLPENHPWATKKPMSAEQEAAISARLQVRPRRAQAPTGAEAGRPRVRQHRGE